jgi:hypothetical protein
MKYPHYKFLNFDVIYDYKTVYWRLAFLGAPNSFCYSTDGIDEHSSIGSSGCAIGVSGQFFGNSFPFN